MARLFVRTCTLKCCVLLAVVFFVKVYAAANVTMVWDPSPSPNVAAYRVYYGAASHAYGAYVQAAAPATNVVVSNLGSGTTYYFGAKAVDALGAESGFSNEATYTTAAT